MEAIESPRYYLILHIESRMSLSEVKYNQAKRAITKVLKNAIGQQYRRIEAATPMTSFFMKLLVLMVLGSRIDLP